jgi:hypothetical protein
MKDQSSYSSSSSSSSSSSWLLNDLERIIASSTPQRQLVQLRIRHGGSLAEQFVQQQPPPQQQGEAAIAALDDHWMAILDRIIGCDATLAEEIVCHPSFRIPTSPRAHHHHGDTATSSSCSHDDEEEEDDDVSNREELVYRIFAFQKQFSLQKQQCCFFTNEELYQRLPISLSFGPRPPSGGAAGGGDEDDDISSVLLHRVTQRQSAQSDVGFGTYFIIIIIHHHHHSLYIRQKTHIISLNKLFL